MTTEELNKYVAEQFAKGVSMETIARSLGITLECLYRKMGKKDEDKE